MSSTRRQLLTTVIARLSKQLADLTQDATERAAEVPPTIALPHDAITVASALPPALCVEEENEHPNGPSSGARLCGSRRARDGAGDDEPEVDDQERALKRTKTLHVAALAADSGAPAAADDSASQVSLLYSGEVESVHDDDNDAGSDDELDPCILCENSGHDNLDTFHLCSNGAISRIRRDPCAINRLCAHERSADDAVVSEAVGMLASHSMRVVDVHNNDLVGRETVRALSRPHVARVVEVIDLAYCHGVKVDHMIELFDAYRTLHRNGCKVALKELRLPPCTNVAVLSRVADVPMLRGLLISGSRAIDNAAVLSLLRGSAALCSRLEYLALERLDSIDASVLAPLRYSRALSRLRIKDCPEVNLADVASLVRTLPSLNSLQLFGFGNRASFNEAVMQRHLMPRWSMTCMYSLHVDETILPASSTVLLDLFRRYPLTHLKNVDMTRDQRADFAATLAAVASSHPTASGVQRIKCHCDPVFGRPPRGAVMQLRQ